MRQLILLFGFIFGLVGCVPAALMVGATAGGAVVYDKRPMKVMVADHRAANKIRHQLKNNRELHKNSAINVSVFNGIVLLTGQAATKTLSAQAAKYAQENQYTKRVYNRISISGPEGTLKNINDAWLSNKIRLHMLTKSGLQSSNVKVVTENGVVYLMGSISRKQAALAARVASSVSGVQKVVKVFEYE